MQNCYRSNMDSAAAEQTERLTRKHIQTLSFMQEIVKENKELKEQIDSLEAKLAQCAEIHKFAEESKERISEIQKQYLDKADEINSMLIEKNKEEIVQKVEEHLTAEKKWNEERNQLKTEIEKLEKENKRLTQDLNQMNEIQDHAKILLMKVDSLTDETERLKNENAEMQKRCEKDLFHIEQIRKLGKQNTELQHEINELKQKNKELKIKFEKTEKSLDELKLKTEQDELVLTLKNKLGKLHKERSLHEQKENEYDCVIQELKEENSKLRRALSDSEKMRSDLQTQMELLLQQLSLVKGKPLSSDSQTFKDFVQLKREYASLREENEELKLQIKQTVMPKTLPSLKDQSQSHRKSKTQKAARKSSSDSSTSLSSLTWK